MSSFLIVAKKLSATALMLLCQGGLLLGVAKVLSSFLPFFMVVPVVGSPADGPMAVQILLEPVRTQLGPGTPRPSLPVSYRRAVENHHGT
jgi:hypothetical protein